MIVQLQPKDVSAFWPGISRALIASQGIKEEHREQWLLHALEKILCGKLQCWISYEPFEDEEGNRLKKLHIMVVTSILEDRLFGYKSLILEALYGFRKSPNELWLETLEGLKTFCKNSDCQYIRALTNNERAKEIANLLGFFEFASYYSMEV